MLTCIKVRLRRRQWTSSLLPASVSVRGSATMHGLFSFFKKKPAPRAVVKDETTTRHESFCDVNELMPDETKLKVQPPAEARRSKKKFAAPTAPEPRSDVAAKPIPEESTETVVESSQKEESHNEAGSKQESTENDVQNTVEHKTMNSHEEKPSAVHVHEVIHYSPQSTVRSSTMSPPPDSDMPYVERRSNIVLNDKTGRKTIPVTQFDGTISKPREKKAAAPPPPLPTTPPPPLATGPQPLDTPTGKTSSSNSASETEPMRGAASPKGGPRQRPSEEDNVDVQNAAEITREYETLKAKFDLWQALQTENRNSSEARQLHVRYAYVRPTRVESLRKDATRSPGRLFMSVTSLHDALHTLMLIIPYNVVTS
ncbi:hypothetical protein Y032_0359g3430 [Ancylostoma ceylanicum]|uniref:Uncharacterized protein n=1 Tax=Ancylostoma ceylanicum TaxID=53326 RepID=A0A016RVZ4_9BILA|nr:hypothetical protein Y032_0359g3430 [Ancylostoma ceylanicum]